MADPDVVETTLPTLIEHPDNDEEIKQDDDEEYDDVGDILPPPSPGASPSAGFVHTKGRTMSEFLFIQKGPTDDVDPIPANTQDGNVAQQPKAQPGTFRKFNPRSSSPSSPPSPPPPPPPPPSQPPTKTDNNANNHNTHRVPVIPSEVPKTHVVFRDSDILHPDIPLVSPFGSRGAQNLSQAATQGMVDAPPIRPHLSPERVASKLDDCLMSAASIRRAITFEPAKGDVIIVSPPCAGVTPQISRLIRHMVATDASQPLSHRGSAICLESQYVDDDVDILKRPQFNSSRRVFRTSMTPAMACPRRSPSAMYVVVLRHPLDLRAAWFSHLRKCWEVELTAADPEFDDLYQLDDFASVNMTLCSSAGAGDNVDGEYEKFVSDWWRASREERNVLLVFFESLVAIPDKEVTRIYKFIHGAKATPSPELNTILLKDLGVEQAPVQKRDAASKGGSRRASMAVSIARRVSQFGRRKSRSNSTKSSTIADEFLGMGEASYTHRGSIANIENKWFRFVALAFRNLQTYEALYETVCGVSYPFPQVKPDRRSKRTGSGGSKDAAGSAPGWAVFASKMVKRVQEGISTTATQLMDSEPVMAISNRLSIRKNKGAIPLARRGGGGSRDSKSKSDSGREKSKEYSRPVSNVAAIGVDRNELIELSRDADPHVSSSQNPGFVMNVVGEQPQQQHVDEENTEQKHDSSDVVSTAIPVTQPAPSPSPPPPPPPPLPAYDAEREMQIKMEWEANKGATSKFASQEVFETNLLRDSLKQANMRLSLIEVVAGTQAELSEML